MPMTEEDEALVARIRKVMKRRKGYSEQNMFGGVCFMLNGNMCIGPWKGSLIVRLPKDEHDQTQKLPHALPMDITGKVMKGWARIEPAGIKSDEELKNWIDRAAKFVRSLPAK
jgi:TfoX/Sxy family transcriptional regulator of competence genes